MWNWMNKKSTNENIAVNETINGLHKKYKSGSLPRKEYIEQLKNNLQEYFLPVELQAYFTQNNLQVANFTATLPDNMSMETVIELERSSRLAAQRLTVLVSEIKERETHKNTSGLVFAERYKNTSVLSVSEWEHIRKTTEVEEKDMPKSMNILWMLFSNNVSSIALHLTTVGLLYADMIMCGAQYNSN